MSGREDVLETTGCESYADVSLLFDTLHWPERRRRPAMEEAYRRLEARAQEVRELRRAGYVLAMALLQSPEWERLDEEGQAAAQRFLPEPPEAPDA